MVLTCYLQQPLTTVTNKKLLEEKQKLFYDRYIMYVFAAIGKFKLYII